MKNLINPSLLPLPRWSREQIRAARLVPLAPLLIHYGLELTPRDAGNFILPAYPGLIIKENYWRWPARSKAGNSIDFFVQVLGLSFNDAMAHIAAGQDATKCSSTSSPYDDNAARSRRT